MSSRRAPAIAEVLPPWASEADEVAGVLHAAATMVRDRTEQNASPAADRRPRLHAAICRAITLSGVPAPRARRLRELAASLTANSVDYALGRGVRPHDAGDVIATLDGFGLDVGTIGAVETAAQILTGAAGIAAQIGTARLLDVRGHGRIWAYPLGPVMPAAIEAGDLTPTTESGGVFYRVHRNDTTATGPVFSLDHTIVLVSFTGELAPTPCCTNAWRPVPDAWTAAQQ